MRKVKAYFFITLFLTGILFSIIACSENNAPTEPDNTVFEGLYVAKFEVSSFVPCGNDQIPGYGNGYWLEANPDSNFFEQYETVISDLPSDKGKEEVAVYIRFVGELSQPRPAFNGYGHLGLYTNIITVTKTLDVSLNRECQNK